MVAIRNDSSSMMALGQLKKNDSSLEKQLKKVSSGMRLNSAEDDASGYSVSERMRVMIRSLGQDIQNTQTGKNLVATAEGGMQEIINNLRSMKELAINSANDHNTDLDRETLEKEFASHKEAITDITASTNYNGRLLLTGDYAQYQKVSAGAGLGSGNGTSQVTLISGFQPAFGTCIPDGRTVSAGPLFYPVDSSFKDALLPTIWNYWVATGQTRPALSQQSKQFAVSLDFSNLNISYPSDLDGKGFSILCAGCTQYIDIKFDATTTTTTYDSSPAPPSGYAANSLARAFTIGVQNVTSPADLSKAIFDGIRSVQGQIAGNTNPVDTTSSNVLIDKQHYVRMAEINGSYYFLKAGNEPSMQFINGLYGGPKNEFDNIDGGSSMSLGNPLIIHTGPKANQNVRVFINAMWPKNMGIEDSHVTPIEAALMAMGALDKAVDYALNEITRMGAYQMRLGQTEANLVTNEENTQAAESIIRDADMAREMTGYTKASILSQSAQAMLAQANQNSSNVLSLLQ